MGACSDQRATTDKPIFLMSVAAWLAAGAVGYFLLARKSSPKGRLLTTVATAAVGGAIADKAIENWRDCG